jgi:hypothetical protein
MNIARYNLFENAERRLQRYISVKRLDCAGAIPSTGSGIKVCFKFRTPLEKQLLRCLTFHSTYSWLYWRDNTLLNLDRMFQSKPVVLLWGMMGSGKTSTASEFRKWMLQTVGFWWSIVYIL